MKLVVDVSSNKTITRELTEEEIAQQAIDEPIQLAILEQRAIEEAEKSAKKAELFAKLGLTEDEAKLLLA